MDASTVDKYRLEVARSLPDSGSEKAKKTYTNKHGQTATMNTENIGQRKPAALRVAEISALAADGNRGLCELLACEKFTFFGAVYA